MADHWLIVVLTVLVIVLAATAFFIVVASVALALFVYAFAERTEEGIVNLSMPSIGRSLVRVGFMILSALGNIAKWVAAFFIVGVVTLLNSLPRRKSRR